MGNHSSLREEKNKQKYKKKKIISLLLAVLLFGGIGYGAYVYMKTSISEFPLFQILLCF